MRRRLPGFLSMHACMRATLRCVMWKFYAQREDRYRTGGGGWLRGSGWVAIAALGRCVWVREDWVSGFPGFTVQDCS